MSQHPHYYAYEQIMLNLEEVKKDFNVMMNQKYNDKTDNEYCFFDLNETTRIWCVMPPKEFPNHILSVRFTHKDNDKLDWHKFLERKEKTKNMLLKYELPFEFDFSKDSYFGVFGKLKGYRYLIYKSDSKYLKPCMIRTYLERFKNRKGDPIYTDIEIYNMGDFYCINDKRTNLEDLKYQKEFFNKWFTPRWITKQDLYSRWIPLFNIDGKILRYFSEEIRFNSNFNNQYDDIFKQLYKVKDTFLNKEPNDFKTAEEFFYVFEEKYPTIRQQLLVYENGLLGEKLEKFEHEDKVVVNNPDNKHKILHNQIGKVVSFDNQFIDVMFLNYFTERFYPSEITKRS